MMTSSEVLLRTFFLVVSLLIPISANAEVYVVFRYDDFAGDKPGVRETNTVRMKTWEAEKAVDTLFDRYGLAYVIAIIPKAKNLYGEHGTAHSETVSFDEDREKVEFIKRAVQAGRVEVAQHGFSHINVVSSNHRPGEFRERDYESQLQDISEGKEILLTACDLSGMSTFVPPWNAWTDDTARILRKLGFKILSADRHYYYKSARGLTIIPYTAVLQELELMVEEKLLPDEGIVVVCYHPFEIVRFPGGLGSYYFGVERFAKLLQGLSTMPNVEVGTFVHLAEKCEGLTVERYKKANSMWRQSAFWAKLLPRHLWPGTGKQEVYLTEDEYSQALFYWQAATAGLVAGLLMIGLLVRYLLSLVLSVKWRFRIDVLATLLFCLAVIAEFRLWQRGYHVTGIRALPLFFSTSFVMALVSRIIRKAKPPGKPLPHLNA